jgi:RIO-like serine/threonine protein kinase
MDIKTHSGQVSELKVMADLAAKGYHIFNQISGKAPFDIIAYKDNVLKRISIKSTTKDSNTIGKYLIELRRVRSNKTTNSIYKIEDNEFDILAVYIFKEDKIIYLPISAVIGKGMISIKMEDCQSGLL